MKCPKCGNDNSDTAKFCKHCGAAMDMVIKPEPEKETNTSSGNDNNKTIIAVLIAIIAILAIATLLYTGGFFTSNVELKTHDFDGFSLDVPTDSDFELSDSYKKSKDKLFFKYDNKGGHSKEVSAFEVGCNVTSDTAGANAENVKSDEGVEIYKANDGSYRAFAHGTDANIVLYGEDVNTLTTMAKTFEDSDITKLVKSESKKTKSTQSTTQSASSTPSSISILGGSFSTGSGDADKTYARINVGTKHAGEDVIVQIWYSRDGNTLNHGNMVPATVHSDGYLEISSADAYKYYPDHADINIYDSGSNPLTSKSVSLSPTSGTQTF